MKLTKKRILNKFLRIFPVFGRIRDIDLTKIYCIRHTITWRCNYKCTSCDIWKIEKPRFSGKPSRVQEEASPEHIANMCKSSLLKNVNEIVISGGEPLIRDDFVELIMTYYDNLNNPEFSITINGYDPDRAYFFFDQIDYKTKGKIKWKVIGVSLNGQREVHNKSRGLDCFDNVIKTAQALRDFSNNVAFSFTFLKNNVDHFDYVKQLGKDLGISTHVCWTVMNQRFVAKEKDLVFKNNPNLVSVLERNVGIDKIKFNGGDHSDFIRYKSNIKGAYLYDSILNRRVMPCHAARTFFHLDPYGDVYPCNFDLRPERILGNIKKESIEEIWSRISLRLLLEISDGECMYPNGSLCGDSDINRSIQQVDTPIYEWYFQKRKRDEKLINF